MKPKDRLLSLDVFRGITMASMLLVENPGNWSIYKLMTHARWGFPNSQGIPTHQAITPTDLILPSFLFIMGVAVVFALSSKKQELSKHNVLIWKIIKRSAILFALGLFFYAFPSFLSAILYKTKFSIRWTGVLQMISIVYLASAILYLQFSKKTIIWICILVPIIYWGLLTLVPIPGFGDPILMRQWHAPEGLPKNLPNWLDTQVFGYGSPDGIMTTFSAIITGLLGVLSGIWLKANRGKSAALFGMGTILILFGWIWGHFFPVIKDMWTSSYIFTAGGYSMIGLALCYWIVDVKGYKKWTTPFVAYGTNCLAVYIVSHIFGQALRIIKISENYSVHDWIMQHFFLSWLSPMNASLAFALATTIFWLIPLLYLYHKKIYIKV